jgi:hypothetical protein
MSKPPGDKSGKPKANPSLGDDRTKNSGRPGDESLADDLLIGADVIAEFNLWRPEPAPENLLSQESIAHTHHQPEQDPRNTVTPKIGAA